MKKIILILFSIFLSTPFLKAQYDHSAAEKLGWKLASQAWTFREFTFAETLDKLNKLGVKYVEMYPRQTIGGGIEGKTHFSMDEATRKKVSDLAKSKGVTIINYGVVRGKDEAEWRQIFEFAKAMGIETITSEPEPDQFDYVDKMCQEFKVQVAIHNHPVPSRYWHPTVVLRALEGRSKYMGVCGDLGHWARSGLDPVDCVQQVGDKMISFHFKDLNQFGVRKAHDVPWGSGVCNMGKVMHEMKNRGFEGVFSIEYEYNWKNSLPEVEESTKYFNRVAYWLVKE